MSAGAGRSFGENGYRLLTLERLRDGNRLVPGALAVRPLDVDRRILVGEPVNQRMSELVLRHEGAAGGAADHQDVEPADVVGDEQRVAADWCSFQSGARADDPCRGCEKAARPARGAEQRFRNDVGWSEDGEQADQPRSPQGGTRVHANG